MSFGNGGYEGRHRRQMVLYRKLLILVILLAPLVVPAETDASQDFPNCSTWNEVTDWATGGLPPDDTWVPSTYYVETGQYDPDSRYILTEFIWDDASGFGLGSTFEAEFFLNNSDNSNLGEGIFLSGDEDFWEVPILDGFDSNLPSWYLDTRSGDAGDPGDRVETAFTIGAGRADDIQAGTLYFTLIIGSNGTTTTDNGRLAAQLGCQAPMGCRTTWCSYSARVVDLLPAWDVPVPGLAGIGTQAFDDTHIRDSYGLPPRPDRPMFPGLEPDAPIEPVLDSPTTDTGKIESEIVEPETPNQPVIEGPAPPAVQPPAPVPPEPQQPAPVEPEPQQPQATLNLDVQRWCQEVYADPNAVATALDFNDPYSWVCETNGQQRVVDMNNAAERQHGLGHCAYLVGPTAYDWKAGPCQ